MKNIFILFILSPLFTYSQTWEWAKQVGNNSALNEDAKVITDGANYYLIGDFGRYSMTTETTTLGSNGDNDMFIIKYDNNGTELWAKNFGGNNDVMVTGKTQYESVKGVYDKKCNCIYLSGNFFIQCKWEV